MGIIRHSSSTCSKERNHSCGSSVKWSTSPVSSTREYPTSTKPQDRRSLFYTSRDYERFREEYKLVLQAQAMAHLTKNKSIVANENAVSSSPSSGCASCILNMILPKSLAGMFQRVSTSMEIFRQGNAVHEEFNQTNLLVDTMYLF
mmetsp:Transcript_3438/g.4657  ORF Transcript_3438/g.4657 Transcript_3438/m.4657 type:complete len:146 (-) Transcript_3438:316-753(-)